MRLGDFLTSSSSASTTAGNNYSAHAESRATSPQSRWTVRGTKKGALPVALETRKNGKVVIISNIDGDLNALLKDVKKALGTGGVARPSEGYVEIQGAHHEKVCQFLLKSGQLSGVKKETISSSAEALKNKKNGGNNKSDNGKAHLNAKASSQQPAASKPIIIVGDATENDKPIPDTKTIKAMKPPELRTQLAARGASILGNKKELIARLLAMKKVTAE